MCNNNFEQAELQDKFYSPETRTFKTSSEIGLTKEEIISKLKFIHITYAFTRTFPINGHNTFGSWFKSQLDNQYYEKGKEEKKVVLPPTTLENLVKKGGQAGLIPANPDISISNTGEVSIGDVTTDTLVKELEGTKDIEFDLDLPTNNNLLDKFPFSLPFDLIKIIEIFVYPEKEPIFTIPIKATFKSGENVIEGMSEIVLVDIDEELVLDLTMFKVGGVDIVKVLFNSMFYVFWALFLIRVTPKLQM